MNSAFTLATLTRKRAAVLAWIDANDLPEKATDATNEHLVCWHWSYSARLDDAIAYLETRVDAQRLFGVAA
jgi:hypothetical protein